MLDVDSRVKVYTYLFEILVLGADSGVKVYSYLFEILWWCLALTDVKVHTWCHSNKYTYLFEILMFGVDSDFKVYI